MLGVHNPNAADGQKPLALISRVSAAADWERYAFTYLFFSGGS
jgi:hypothetical protein